MRDCLYDESRPVRYGTKFVAVWRLYNRGRQSCSRLCQEGRLPVGVVETAVWRCHIPSVTVSGWAEFQAYDMYNSETVEFSSQNMTHLPISMLCSWMNAVECHTVKLFHARWRNVCDVCIIVTSAACDRLVCLSWLLVGMKTLRNLISTSVILRFVISRCMSQRKL